ncbi:hypothetical protein BRC91_03950 [Halobacteriales archaeon QS_4_62_28]|nr:MAG: hypothetical protein BRC91_03950 [Halobacteriales archaeon QS_4_62_28]
MSKSAADKARPTFPGASVVEVAMVLALLLAFQFAFAASGYPLEVFNIVHRVLYIATAALACTWTLRLTDGFTLQNLKVTVVLVASGIVAVIVLTPVDPLLVGGFLLVVAVALLGTARWGNSLAWWTPTHTTLLLVVLGTTAMFAAAGPRAVETTISSIGFGIELTPIVDGLTTRVEIVREGATSTVYVPLVAVGAGLYLLGRLLE